MGNFLVEFKMKTSKRTCHRNSEGTSEVTMTFKRSWSACMLIKKLIMLLHRANALLEWLDFFLGLLDCFLALLVLVSELGNFRLLPVSLRFHLSDFGSHDCFFGSLSLFKLLFLLVFGLRGFVLGAFQSFIFGLQWIELLFHLSETFCDGSFFCRLSLQRFAMLGLSSFTLSLVAFKLSCYRSFVLLFLILQLCFQFLNLLCSFLFLSLVFLMHLGGRCILSLLQCFYLFLKSFNLLLIFDLVFLKLIL